MFNSLCLNFVLKFDNFVIFDLIAKTRALRATFRATLRPAPLGVRLTSIEIIGQMSSHYPTTVYLNFMQNILRIGTPLRFPRNRMGPTQLNVFCCIRIDQNILAELRYMHFISYEMNSPARKGIDS